MSVDDKQRLIVSYLPSVKAIASQIARRIPQADRDELIGYGAIGLCQAADRFDPERGLPFGAYAQRRIVGAMIDGVRSMSWAAKRNTRPTALVPIEGLELGKVDADIDLRLSLSKALAMLPPAEREMIEAVWIRGEEAQAAAHRLGFSKSWGSRLESNGLMLMRPALE